MKQETYCMTTWMVALLLSLSVTKAHAKSWGSKFVEKVKDTGAQLDPTNPNGAVRTGAESVAKGVQDPLRVVRHAGDVLKEIGVDVQGAAQDPIQALNNGIKVFKKEAKVLETSLVSLREQAQSLPKLKAPSSISFNLGKIAKMPSVSIASVNLGPGLAMIKAGIAELGEAGKVIERFVMKDIPREAKRFGGDVNREARKVGDDIAREWKYCWAGGCNAEFLGFGEAKNCDEMSGQDELDCRRKELRDKQQRRQQITDRINGAYQSAKTKIDEAKGQITREFSQLDAEVK